MTFPEMVADLNADFKGAALRRTGALAQLAGLVKGLVSAVDSEAAEALNTVVGTRIKVYLPKAKKTAAMPRKDAELRAVEADISERGRAEKERAAVVAKVSKVKGYAEMDKLEQEAVVSRVLSMRRAKERAKEEEKAQAVAAAKAREEGVRAEFAGRFARPEKAVGKTERFEGYVAELKEAVERERLSFEKAGLAQGKTDLVKELERAQKTGKIRALSGKDADKASSLLESLKGSTRDVGSGVAALHDDLSGQLLGPFAGFYSVTKGFVTSTARHYTESAKTSAKNFMAEHLNREKLLAEMGHLRKEGKEVPAALRLQMMLSTVLNVVMSGLFGLLKAAPLIAGGLLAVKMLGTTIGTAIFERLPWWMGGPGKEGEEEKASEAASEGRGKRVAEGKRTSEDIAYGKLGERIAAMQARKAGWSTEPGGPLSKAEEADLRGMMDIQAKMQRQAAKDAALGVTGETGGFLQSLRRANRGGGGGLLKVIGEMQERRREKEEAERLLTATEHLQKSAEALAAKPAAPSGSAVNVNAIQSGAGGAEVHSHTEKSTKYLFETNDPDEVVM